MNDNSSFFTEELSNTGNALQDQVKTLHIYDETIESQDNALNSLIKCCLEKEKSIKNQMDQLGSKKQDIESNKINFEIQFPQLLKTIQDECDVCNDQLFFLQTQKELVERREIEISNKVQKLHSFLRNVSINLSDIKEQSREFPSATSVVEDISERKELQKIFDQIEEVTTNVSAQEQENMKQDAKALEARIQKLKTIEIYQKYSKILTKRKNENNKNNQYYIENIQKLLEEESSIKIEKKSLEKQKIQIQNKIEEYTNKIELAQIDINNIKIKISESKRSAEDIKTSISEYKVARGIFLDKTNTDFDAKNTFARERISLIYDLRREIRNIKNSIAEERITSQINVKRQKQKQDKIDYYQKKAEEYANDSKQLKIIELELERFDIASQEENNLFKNQQDKMIGTLERIEEQKKSILRPMDIIPHETKIEPPYQNCYNNINKKYEKRIKTIRKYLNMLADLAQQKTTQINQLKLQIDQTQRAIEKIKCQNSTALRCRLHNCFPTYPNNICDLYSQKLTQQIRNQMSYNAARRELIDKKKMIINNVVREYGITTFPGKVAVFTDKSLEEKEYYYGRIPTC